MVLCKCGVQCSFLNEEARENHLNSEKHAQGILREARKRPQNTNNANTDTNNNGPKGQWKNKRQKTQGFPDDKQNKRPPLNNNHWRDEEIEGVAPGRRRFMRQRFGNRQPSYERDDRAKTYFDEQSDGKFTGNLEKLVQPREKQWENTTKEDDSSEATRTEKDGAASESSEVSSSETSQPLVKKAERFNSKAPPLENFSGVGCKVEDTASTSSEEEKSIEEDVSEAVSNTAFLHSTTSPASVPAEVKSNEGDILPAEKQKFALGSSMNDCVLPDMFSVHQATVESLSSYGAMVKLHSSSQSDIKAFLHISQMTELRGIKSADEILRIGDVIWIKTIDIAAPLLSGNSGSILVSMKFVSQHNGRDLDPKCTMLAEIQQLLPEHGTGITFMRMASKQFIKQ